MSSLPEFVTSLQAGPERREVALRQAPLGDLPLGDGHALVRNRMTLIDSGYDLALLERSADENRWLPLGRLALGRVEREAPGGPRRGEWIYWHGPHADFAALDVRNDLWVRAPALDARLLPAGIGAEAAHGIHQAERVFSSPPEEAVVLGQGMLGHLAAQWLQHRGCKVTVVDNSPKRLEFSRKSGLKRKIDTHNSDWMEQLRDHHPAGVRLLVDATGAPGAIESLLPILASRSALCLLGPWRSRPLPSTVSARLEALSAIIVGPAPWFGHAPKHAALTEEWLTLIHDGAIPTERLLTHHIVPAEAPMAIKRFAAGIRSWQGAVIHWEDGAPESSNAPAGSHHEG